MKAHWLTGITFLPLAGAFLLLLFPPRAQEAIRRTALGVAVLEFGLCLPLFFWFDPTDPGFQFQEWAAWMVSPPIHYHLGIDALSLFLILLTALLTPLALLASWGIRQRVKEFFLLLLMLETGLLGVFVSLDLVLFYIFWEVMLVPMYLLIGIWGHERRLYAAIKFLLYTLAGSLLMLVGILWIYAHTGTFSLLSLYNQLLANPDRFGAGAERWLFWAFFLAFAVKVPLFPLHTWLPDAHGEAPTAGSVLLAGVLLKMGAYGLLRFCLPLFPNAAKEFAPLLTALGLIGILYGALVSLVQPDLKRLIAYSSVSHMGFVVLGIAAMNAISIQGATLLMLAHGLSTGGLFLLAGMLYDRRHTHQIQEFGGLATPLPVYSSFLVFTALASLGLPPLVNWVGEFLILLGVFEQDPTAAVLAAGGVVLAAVTMLWMVKRVVFGEVVREANRSLPDLSRRELCLLVPLALLLIGLGVASPLCTRRLEATTQRILFQLEPPSQRLAETPGRQARR